MTTKQLPYNTFLTQALKYGFTLYGTAKTGQQISYTNFDDGYYRCGFPRTAPRYTDNGDGTISDSASGLTWIKDLNGAGCGYNGYYSWLNAIDFCHTLDFAGFSDWRLPNIKELVSLTDYGTVFPILDPVFLITDWGMLWSATTVFSGGIGAYCLDTVYGDLYPVDKTEETLVLPVRSKLT